MSPSLRWIVCLIPVAVVAGYVALAPVVTPREPFADRGWSVDSVMVLDPNVTHYKLAEPFRVFREGRLTLVRPNEDATTPVVRLDLTIDGEHVTVFTRRRE